MSKPRSEDALQKTMMQYIKLQYPNLLVLAVPNGGSRHPAEAAKLKGMGVLPGVSDILLIWKGPHNETNIGAIELKVGRNKMTPSQIAFKDKWESCGGKFAECRSLEAVIATLKEWL